MLLKTSGVLLRTLIKWVAQHWLWVNNFVFVLKPSSNKRKLLSTMTARYLVGRKPRLFVCSKMLRKYLPSLVANKSVLLSVPRAWVVKLFWRKLKADSALEWCENCFWWKRLRRDLALLHSNAMLWHRYVRIARCCVSTMHSSLLNRHRFQRSENEIKFFTFQLSNMQQKDIDRDQFSSISQK